MQLLSGYIGFWPTHRRITRALWNNGRALELVKVGGPALLFGVRLWVSVCLALLVAFWLELDNAYWAGASAAVVCQPSLGASLRKGWFRMLGTVVGAVAIVALTACFPQDRTPFLIGLALWGAACTFVATLLRNFAAYGAALAGVTAAIIAGGQLGAAGGPSGDAFMLAITRASEICIGIVCAGMVLAVSDFGGSRRKLAALIGVLSAELSVRFTRTLASAGSDFAETQSVRRELLKRVIALNPVIDEAIGESSQLRYQLPVLQNAVNGLLIAMAGWRTTAVLLARLPAELARQEAASVLALSDGTAGVRRLIALPARTPSLRLLADQTAVALVGISRALDGMTLLSGARHHDLQHRGARRLYIADWLPPLVNAARAFVTIGAVELFWIITQWPNGAAAITFATVGVVVLALRADQAYATAISFIIGACVTAVFSAIIAFGLLPHLQSFPAFCLAIGLLLIPAGAGMAQPWRTAAFVAAAAYFVPLLAPANVMSYDIARFYNSALAIVGGLGAAALSFRLLPPLSPRFRTRRLLALSLGDLRRLITQPATWTPDRWQGCGYARLLALPDAATPEQRAHLLAAQLVGAEIMQLRRAVRRHGRGAALDAGLAVLARGDVTLALALLARFDSALAGARRLRARARLLAISSAIEQHAAYFAMGPV